MSAVLTHENAAKARIANAGLFIATGLMVGAWAPQIPQLLARHNIGEGMMGVMILILGLGAIGAMMFSGHAIARFGSRKVMVWAGLSLIPVLPLVAHAPNLWTLGLAVVLFGAAMGTMDVAMNANAVEIEQKLGKPIMSSAHGFWSLGGFLGGIGGAWTIAVTSAQTQSLIAALAIVLVLAVSFPLARGSEVSQADTSKARKSSAMPKSKVIFLLGFMALCSFVPEGAVLDWAAVYMSEHFTADKFTAGLGFAFYSAMMAIMRFAGDPIRARLGAVKTMYISGTIAVFGLGLAAFAPDANVAIVGFAIAGIGGANMVPLIFSAAGNYPGEDPSRAIATVTICGYTGVLVAPASIGYAGELFGFSAAFMGIAAVTALVTILGRAVKTADGAKGH